MKNIKALIVSIALIGCNHNDSNNDESQLSISNIDFNGVWLLSNEVQRYKVSNDEYLTSTFYKETYIFEDTESGVKYNSCKNYGGISNYGIKADTHFYLSVSDNGFYINNDGVLEQDTDFSNNWEPDFTYKSIAKLTQISAVPSVDSGTFIVSGPIAFDEYSHVCIWEAEYSLGNGKTYEVIAPYGDSYISLWIETQDNLSPGVFNYAQGDNDYLVRADLISNASEFWNIVGSNTIGTKSSTIEFIEYSDTKMSGTYSLTAHDDSVYTGEFEVFFTR